MILSRPARLHLTGWVHWILRLRQCGWYWRHFTASQKLSTWLVTVRIAIAKATKKSLLAVLQSGKCGALWHQNRAPYLWYCFVDNQITPQASMDNTGKPRILIQKTYSVIFRYSWYFGFSGISQGHRPKLSPMAQFLYHLFLLCEMSE